MSTNPLGGLTEMLGSIAKMATENPDIQERLKRAKEGQQKREARERLAEGTESLKPDNIWSRDGEGARLRHVELAPAHELDRDLFSDIRGSTKLLEAAHQSVVHPTVPSTVVDELNSLVGMAEPKQRFQEVADYLIGRTGAVGLGTETAKARMNMLYLKGPDGAGQRDYARVLGDFLRERDFLTGNENKGFVGTTAAAVASKGAESAGKAVNSALGGVLYIAELDGFKEAKDGKAALQALRLLAEEHTDKVAIVFAGTKEEVDALNTIDRRFRPDLGQVVDFKNLNDLEIGQEAMLYAKSMGYTMGRKAVAAVVELLSKRRDGGAFFNKDEVHAFVDQAIIRRGAQATELGRQDKSVSGEEFLGLTPKDFGLDNEKRREPLEEIEAHFVGNEKAKEVFRELDQTIREMKANSPDIPWQELRPQIMKLVEPAFVLVGPTGTGKTTLGREIGRFFGAHDLLPGNGENFVEVGQSDVTGSHIGEAAEKTSAKHVEARGGIYFFNEAYAVLGGEYSDGKSNPYGHESIDEHVRLMTHPDFEGHMGWVFDGYEGKMRKFLRENEGFANRIKHVIKMEVPDEARCIEIFGRQVQEDHLELDDDALLKAAEVIHEMRSKPGFANGRDIETFYKKVKRRTLVNGNYAKKRVTLKDVTQAGEQMLNDNMEMR